MYDEAEELKDNPPDYNLYAFNCNHMAQTILAEAGLDFTDTKGSSWDEKVSLYTVILPGGLTRIGTQYIKDKHNHTIPNDAYDHGVSLAEKEKKNEGWIVGEIEE